MGFSSNPKLHYFYNRYFSFQAVIVLGVIGASYGAPQFGPIGLGPHHAAPLHKAAPLHHAPAPIHHAPVHHDPYKIPPRPFAYEFGVQVCKDDFYSQETGRFSGFLLWR